MILAPCASRHGVCVDVVVVRAFVAVSALLLASAGAGCTLVIPVDQYRGDPVVAGTQDAGDVEGAALEREASPIAEDASMPDENEVPESDATAAADARAAVDARGVDARSDVSSGRVRDGSTDTGPHAEASDTGAAEQSDASLPEGSTPACHLACDGTFCCNEQVCCPSVCGTKRCVLGASCPSKEAVACN